MGNIYVLSRIFVTFMDVHLVISSLSHCQNIKLFNYIVQNSLIANAVLAGFIVKMKIQITQCSVFNN